MLDVRRKDVLLGHMISEELVLFKLKGFHEDYKLKGVHGDYWTLMNDRGYIEKMPEKMETLLNKNKWVSLRVSKIETKGVRLNSTKIFDVNNHNEGTQEDNQANDIGFEHPIMIVVSNYNE